MRKKVYRSEKCKRLCSKNAKCLTVSASILVFVLGEFLHHDFLVKHAGMDVDIKSQLRQICVAKEVFLGYAVIGCIATRVSYVVSILCTFILCLPVLLVLNLMDGEKQPLEKEDIKVEESDGKCSPSKIDSNRIQPTSSTKLDPLSDAKDLNTEIGFRRNDSRIENSA